MESLKQLPQEAQLFYDATYQKSLQRNNDELLAKEVAWGVVKSKFEKVGGEWIARAGAFNTQQFYTFKAEKAEEFVSRTDEGHLVHNYVLSDIMPDDKGTNMTESLLNKWANWINEALPSIDTDHELWDKAIMQHAGNVDLISRAMKAKQGIARAVKAFVKNGRLIVSVMFDKRYERFANRIKGLSVEAAAEREGNTFVDGKLFGFTLALNKTPVNPRAVRIIS